MPAQTHNSTEWIIEEAFRSNFYYQYSIWDELIQQSSMSQIHRSICEWPSYTWESLNSSDPDIRYYALRIMQLPWRDKDRFRKACIKLVNDPDIGVADFAIHNLADLFADSGDQFVIKLLIAIIRNSDRSVQERMTAYFVFNRVIGNSYSLSIDVITAEQMNNIIDWQLINNYTSD